MGCCGSHNDQKDNKQETGNSEETPKGFVGRYLHNLGKKDFEKEKQGGKSKGGCC